MYQLQKQLSKNASFIVDSMNTRCEHTQAIQWMQIILAGSLSFAILDQLSGTWTVVNKGWTTSFAEGIFGASFVWMLLNFLFWFGFKKMIEELIITKAESAAKVIDVRMLVNESCAMDRLDKYLETKHIIRTQELSATHGIFQRKTWVEKSAKIWGGALPQITLEYDAKHSYMSFISAHCSKVGSVTAKLLRDVIMDELYVAQVLHEPQDEEDEEYYEEDEEEDVPPDD